MLSGVLISVRSPLLVSADTPRAQEKQAAINNETALGQLASVRVVTELVHQILGDIERLSICGLAKLHSMCEFVRLRDSPLFETQDRWGLCGVSGCPTSECVVLGEHREWAVDISYLHFFRMLWIVFHVDHIEHSKFMHYIDSRPCNEKTIDSLKFLQLDADYTPEIHYDTYLAAFHYVHETLSRTVDSYIDRYSCTKGGVSATLTPALAPQ